VSAGRKNVAVYDERRNTSRVFPVAPGALEAALAACARFRAEHPAHAQWLIDGHPTLTEDEHIRRFGSRYQ
jgi:hypothetical protein